MNTHPLNFGGADNASPVVLGIRSTVSLRERKCIMKCNFKYFDKILKHLTEVINHYRFDV